MPSVANSLAPNSKSGYAVLRRNTMSPGSSAGRPCGNHQQLLRQCAFQMLMYTLLLKLQLQNRKADSMGQQTAGRGALPRCTRFNH